MNLHQIVSLRQLLQWPPHYQIQCLFASPHPTWWLHLILLSTPFSWNTFFTQCLECHSPDSLSVTLAQPLYIGILRTWGLEVFSVHSLSSYVISSSKLSQSRPAFIFILPLHLDVIFLYINAFPSSQTTAWTLESVCLCLNLFPPLTSCVTLGKWQHFCF